MFVVIHILEYSLKNVNGISLKSLNIKKYRGERNGALR